MKTIIANKIRQIDYLFTSACLKLIGERKSLIIFLFHALFRNANECSSNIVHPQQGITLECFREFIEYYLAHGYTFISPEGILNGLDNKKNYALITFDDGYYNNQLALPILNHYKIPCVFFISTDYIEHNKSFFWDALFREKTKQRVSTKAIIEEINLLKSSKTNEEIERYLTDEFGKEALTPIGDIDRPFTPSELRNFAKEKFVYLGNHTSEHAYLANCSSDEIRSTIFEAQNSLYDITGTLPHYISYPDGAYSSEVIKITRQMGFRLGMAVDNKKNYLPIDFQSDKPLRLGRFPLGQNSRLIKQCQLFRSDIRLTKIIKSLIGKE